jgi:2-dehydro-3-deoxyphosphogluconate aldolase/(4S)-4-hydroxy-2-oxoglutarate aldolase
MTKEISSQIFNTRIVPVVVINKSKDAIPTGAALLSGGQRAIEVTLRTDAGLRSIELLSSNDELIVGAGTVRNLKEAKDAVNAGAKFIVSPGFDDAVVSFALEQGLPVLPGTVTASEIMRALTYDLPVLKFFPANISGGWKAIKAFGGPFPGTYFVPTGGVSAENMKDYLSLPNVPAVGGSWMVTAKMIDEQKFDEITRLTKEAIEIAG